MSVGGVALGLVESAFKVQDCRALRSRGDVSFRGALAFASARHKTIEEACHRQDAMVTEGSKKGNAF
eukprot:scaffold1786_cov250-Pinguiococcus_pyrenoidosus.AAC.12